MDCAPGPGEKEMNRAMLERKVLVLVLCLEFLPTSFLEARHLGREDSEELSSDWPVEVW